MKTWTVQISVADCWIEDGFDLTPERLKYIIEGALPFSATNETGVRILKAPAANTIARLMGYKNNADRVSRN